LGPDDAGSLLGQMLKMDTLAACGGACKAFAALACQEHEHGNVGDLDPQQPGWFKESSTANPSGLKATKVLEKMGRVCEFVFHMHLATGLDYVLAD
jgi:hypothetical protein